MKRGLTHKDPTISVFFPPRGPDRALWLNDFPEIREKFDADIRIMLRLAVMYGWLAHRTGVSLHDAKEKFNAIST